MNGTHKLHAIFTQKTDAEAAMDLMMQTGVFERNQIFLIEVPSLVETDEASAHNRPRRLPEFLEPPRVVALTGGAVLAVAASYSLLDFVILDGKTLSTMIIGATLGAFVGLATGWLAHTRRRAVGDAPESSGKNWVLVAHANTESEVELAEELLASARLSSKLRLLRRGGVYRPKIRSWSRVSG